MTNLLITVMTFLAFDPDAPRVEVTQKFENGVHIGCETSFDVTVEDRAYNGGQSVAVSGHLSLLILADQEKPVFEIKLGVSNNGIDFKPPSNAYVINGYETNESEQISNSESDTHQFSIFRYDESGIQTRTVITRLFYRRTVDLAYTFGNRSLATTFPVILSERQNFEWKTCVTALPRRNAVGTN